MGGDLKWIASVYGLKSANSNYPCPWCLWKNEPIDISNEFIQQNRRVEDTDQFIKKRSSNEQKGHADEPLFKFIDFNKCIVDILHLFLRVTDKLFFNLLNRLEQLDIKFSGYKTGKIDNMNLTKTFLDFLSTCDITSPFYIKSSDDGSSKYKLRKLNMNERLKILNKLFTRNCVLEIFKNCDKKIKDDNELLLLNFVFSEFYEIYKSLTDFENFNKKTLITKLKEWLKSYTKISNNVITPYIHVLCFHVPEFIDQYGPLRKYSMQGLEKFNDITKINYFMQTNHQKNFHVSLIKKINRLEFIDLKGKIID